jgi:hypothetical protein
VLEHGQAVANVSVSKLSITKVVNIAQIALDLFHRIENAMKRTVNKCKAKHDSAEYRRKIKRLEKKLMADLTKLNATIAAEAAILAQTNTDVDALIAAGGTGDQAAVDAATQAVQANVDAATALDNKVKAALPPTP